ncbi:hypothetical protein D9M72_546810 [compost metagenome]
MRSKIGEVSSERTVLVKIYSNFSTIITECLFQEYAFLCQKFYLVAVQVHSVSRKTILLFIAVDIGHRYDSDSYFV